MAETDTLVEDSETPCVCTNCNTTFQEADEFRNHTCKSIPKYKQKNYPYYRPGHFTCEKCNKVFTQRRNLAMHKQTHNETLDFVCSICKKQFNTRLRLRCHFQVHTGRHSCPICQKTFGESGNLKKHLRIHSGEKPFVCDVCNKGFTQKRHLQDHQLTHTGELDHQCDVCGKKFLTKRTLKVHRQSHETQLPFGCKKCNACFSEYSNLQVHLCNHTNDKQFYCNVCGKGFKRHYDLKSHLTVHTGEQPYSCEICNRSFHKYAILKLHTETHTNERRHVCHLCNKAFKTFNVLKKHCLLHTGERNKICEICNKTFKCSNTLRTHYLTHSDERPFACDICGKTFKRITPLQNHFTTHTGELKFPCEICGKRFARKSTLENHLILHTGEKPYICPICQRGFSRKSSLKIHHATVHVKDAEPKIFDNRNFHLLAGDLVRHAILAKHTFIANQDKSKQNELNESVPASVTSKSENSSEVDSKEDDGDDDKVISSKEKLLDTSIPSVSNYNEGKDNNGIKIESPDVNLNEDGDKVISSKERHLDTSVLSVSDYNEGKDNNDIKIESPEVEPQILGLTSSESGNYSEVDLNKDVIVSQISSVEELNPGISVECIIDYSENDDDEEEDIDMDDGDKVISPKGKNLDTSMKSVCGYNESKDNNNIKMESPDVDHQILGSTSSKSGNSFRVDLNKNVIGSEISSVEELHPVISVECIIDCNENDDEGENIASEDDEHFSHFADATISEGKSDKYEEILNCSKELSDNGFKKNAITEKIFSPDVSGIKVEPTYEDDVN